MAQCSSLWWATKNEWLGLLDVAELDPEALYGGFDAGPFDDASSEYVFVARRSPAVYGKRHHAFGPANSRDQQEMITEDGRDHRTLPHV